MKTKKKQKSKVPLEDRILSCLLKKEMSQTDLARAIYNNPDARPGIAKKLKILLENELIKSRATNSKSVIYSCNQTILGLESFTQKEKDFINLIIKRFWNPKPDSSIDNLRDLLLQAIIIKKAYAINEKLFSYNPSKDLEHYNKNKTLFWEDKKFRRDFLDKIDDKERKLKQKVTPLARNYLFCCLLAPESLFNKIDGKHRLRNNPLNTSFLILEFLKPLKC